MKLLLLLGFAPLALAGPLLASCNGAVAPIPSAAAGDDGGPGPDASSAALSEAGPPTGDASLADSTVGQGTQLACARSSAAPVRPAEYPWAATPGPDGRIYVAMGPAGSAFDVAAYDVVANTWTSLPPLPVPGGYAQVSAAATASTVYFLADVGNGPFVPTLYAYDAAAGAWKTRAPFALTIDDASVSLGGTAQLVAVGSHLYVTAGETTGLYAYDEPSDSWSVLAFPPVQFDNDTVVATGDGRLFVLGAENAAYTIASDTWVTVPDEPFPRYLEMGAFAGGRIYTFGGFCSSSYPACGNEDDVLDVASGAWSTGSRLPFAVGSGGAAVLACDGRIYVFGGDAGTQRFDPVAQTWDWSP
jgi:N-acetylneuraminic acid mutarotase